VGREKVGKKGVVRDSKDQAQAIASVVSAGLAQGWRYCDVTWSPLVGPAGNIEYLLWLSTESDRAEPTLAELKLLTQSARQALTSDVS